MSDRKRRTNTNLNFTGSPERAQFICLSGSPSQRNTIHPTPKCLHEWNEWNHSRIDGLRNDLVIKTDYSEIAWRSTINSPALPGKEETAAHTCDNSVCAWPDGHGLWPWQRGHSALAFCVNGIGKDKIEQRLV